MTYVDWGIIIVLIGAIAGGLSQGFFRSVCALAGLLLGLSVAAWNYGHLAAWIMPVARLGALANAIAFLLIALLVMAAFDILGKVAAKTLHYMGLGFLDRLAGGAFGFFQGVMLVTLGILVVLAFFPEAHWLEHGKLPRLFFGTCHLSTHMTPTELANRVRHELDMLERDSPGWLHPDGKV